MDAHCTTFPSVSYNWKSIFKFCHNLWYSNIVTVIPRSVASMHEVQKSVDGKPPDVFRRINPDPL